VRRRTLRRRYGGARKRVSKLESLLNYQKLVAQILVRDHGFSPGGAQAAIDHLSSYIEMMHDKSEFASSAALGVARFENEESVIPRRAT
jgi:hypothetical protein